MQYDQNDVHLLALVAWKEARGNGISGCYYVMHVVCNRVGKPGFAATLHDVIMGRNQFTSMSVPSDPEYFLQPPAQDPVWMACLVDAPNVLSGDDDPTKGALYYANEKNIQPGGWYQRNIIDSGLHPVTTVYGKHVFRT